MEKLGIGEWLVKSAQSVYRNAEIPVRVNWTWCSNFLFRVGLPVGSVLSPLLFIIVLEALSEKIRLGCPEELLYVDDSGLVSETLEGMEERIKTWKGALDSNGSQVNVKKTKMMICSENAANVTENVNFPCAVCRKGADSDSILCQFGSLRVHKRCSGIKGKMKEDSKFK